MTINWIIWTVTHLYSYKIKPKHRTNTKNYNIKSYSEKKWKRFETVFWKFILHTLEVDSLLSELPGKLLENNLLHTKTYLVKLSELKRKKTGGRDIHNDQVI